MDCLQAVDPTTLTDFLTSAQDYLCRDLDVTELEARYCDVGDLPPATIYLTQEQIERYEAARWRGLSWYGVTFGSPSVYLWDQPHAPFVLQEEPYMKNRLSLSVCAMTDRSVQLTVEQIDQFSPEYITGSASSLGTMAKAMLRTGVRLQNRPKVVTITRGLADATLRKQLEEAFQCPAAQVLSGRMEGIMAYMCPEGHLHITAEHCYVEILDPKTWTPMPAGKRGLVAVTNLLDETMPHLRVILDYIGTLDPEPCPCGRTLPVLKYLQKVAP
jgi:phenylacetate-CoA ligase